MRAALVCLHFGGGETTSCGSTSHGGRAYSTEESAGTARPGLLRVHAGALVDSDEYGFAHSELVIRRPMWDSEADSCALAEDEATRGAKDGVLSDAFPEAMKDRRIALYAPKHELPTSTVEV